jgi:hypothetical protein
VTGVGKEHVGTAVPAVVLIGAQSQGTATITHKFSFKTGYNEAIVDGWIDVVRVVAGLEGRLVRF